MSLSLASFSFSSTFKATVANTVDGASGITPQASMGVAWSPTTKLANGTGANQATRFWQSTGRTLTGATSETINLYSFAGIDIGGGAGNGPLGGALALTEIVGIFIHNQDVSVGNLTLFGEGSANAWTPVVSSNAVTVGPFKPGAVFEIFEPLQPAWVVGNANNNLLKIASSANVTYDIYVLGRQ